MSYVYRRSKKKTRPIYLHEMVAKDIPNPNHFPYVEHINGNLLDCRRENLRWTDVKPDGYPD